MTDTDDSEDIESSESLLNRVLNHSNDKFIVVWFEGDQLRVGSMGHLTKLEVIRSLNLAQFTYIENFYSEVELYRQSREKTDMSMYG